MEAIIVDDERMFSELFCDALDLLDIKTTRLSDATSAYKFFQNDIRTLEPDTLFFIDVGLDVGVDSNMFPRKATSDINLTGLVLIEKSLEADLFKDEQIRKISLYTSHYTAKNWSSIEGFCSENNLHCFPKSPFLDVYGIHEIVEELKLR